MNATNVNRWIKSRYLRFSETALYGAMTLYLLSQILLTNAPVDIQMALLTYFGALLGIMALCGAAPFSAALSTWIAHRRSALREAASGKSNILSFVLKTKPTGHRSTDDGDGDGRRAA